MIVECKSSAAPDTSHHAQLAAYRLAVRALLELWHAEQHPVPVKEPFHAAS